MSSPTTADGPAARTARLAVLTAGRRAQRLADCGKSVRVIARFDRSAYVCAPDGQLACVGGETLGLGPLNALVGTDDFTAARLAVGDRVFLDARDAVPWRPRPFPTPTADGLRRGLATLDAATAQVPPRGLADRASSDPVTARARRGLEVLTGLIAAPGGEMPREVTSLIGLGPGLTPAGDDALGGAMIALAAFGRPKASEWLASHVLPLAVALTSSISLSHLEAAADGEGAAALHHTLAALAGSDAAGAVDGLRRLDRIGHSSGWDALAGAVAALRGLA
jgi:hypothetical protein